MANRCSGQRHDDQLWALAGSPQFARRRLFDVRTALNLIACGVDAFATANLKDFQELGFKKVWNPLTGVSIRR